MKPSDSKEILNWYFPKDAHQKSEGRSVSPIYKKL